MNTLKRSLFTRKWKILGGSVAVTVPFISQVIEPADRFKKSSRWQALTDTPVLNQIYNKQDLPEVRADRIQSIQSTNSVYIIVLQHGMLASGSTFWPFGELMANEITGIEVWTSYVNRGLTHEGVVPSGRRLAGLLLDIYNEVRQEDIHVKGFILVGHSMGGLIVKDAIDVLKNEFKETLPDDAIKGIICLDVPHLGLRHTPGRPYQPFPPKLVDKTIGEQFARDLGDDQLVYRLEHAVRGIPRVYFGVDDDKIVPLPNAIACCEKTGKAGAFFEHDSTRQTIVVDAQSGSGITNRAWFYSRYGTKELVEDIAFGGHAFAFLWPEWMQNVISVLKSVIDCDENGKNFSVGTPELNTEC